MELTTTSILSLFETDKDQRRSFASGIIVSVIDGEVDPLKVHLQVKCMEDILKQITSDQHYKNAVLEEAEKRGKTFDFHFAKFEKKETGVKYDYSQCNDPELNALTEQSEQISTKIKEKQKFLQTVNPKGLETVSEGGEVVTVYPPAKSSTTSIAVTLK